MTVKLSHAMAVLAAIAIVAAGVAWGFSRSSSPVVPDQVRVAAAVPGESAVTGSWDPPEPPGSPTSFTVADAAGPQVHLFAAPDVPYEPKPVLDHPTWEGLPVVFLVLEEQGPWLHVRVSSRPNNLTAWVQRSEVTLRTVPNRVVVDVSDRTVQVFHGDELLLTETVAVGTDRTPTPLGSFFVDGIVDVPYDNGPYGAYQVSVSGFSNVLESFGGGVGQIALHGTNQPQLLGQPVSNGCVRLSNGAITHLAALAPLGTPVEVVA